MPGSATASNGVSCQIGTEGTVVSSPGEMFRAARDGFGVTPPELAATFGYAGVGDLIQDACTSGRGDADGS